MPPSKLLTPDEVGELLGVAPHTLAMWRYEGRYDLPYVKVGRLVRYREDAVEAFIENQTYADDIEDDVEED